MFEWANLLARPIDPLRAQEVASLNALRAIQGRTMQQDEALKQQEFQQKIAQQNALKQLAAQAQSGGGQVNPLSLLAVTGDPSGAAAFGNIAVQQTRIAEAAQKIRQGNHQYLLDTVASPATTIYDETLKSTGSADAAQKAAQAAYSDALAAAKASGNLSPEEQAQLSPTFDYSRAKANLLSYKDFVTQQREQQTADINKAKYLQEAGPKQVGTVNGQQDVPVFWSADKSTYTDAQGNPATNVHKMGPQAAGNKPLPSPLAATVKGPDGKPTTRPVYREPDGSIKDAITNQVIPPDQVTNIQPASAGRPRSAATAYITKYMEEHPDATAEDLAGASAGFAAQQGGTRAFIGGGKQGDAVRFIGNVVGDHLPTLQKLGEALNNKDTRVLNQLTNAVKTQFGYAGPLNFEAAKSIIAGEITKAVVGGVASMQDRQVLMDDLNRSNSPAQLSGVIDTFRTLLAGQLRGLHRQAQVAKVPDDKFRAMLPKSAQEMLDEGGPETTAAPSSAAPPAPAGGQQGAAAGGVYQMRAGHEAEDWAKIPSGTQYRLPDGRQGMKP